ncbi:Lrp/AsnC family transcriptional regulator [Rhodovibrionaceae bacterium A322]
MQGMDKLDQRLLALLRDNGREPTASLARKLEVSRSTVQERINRLTDRGVIDGFTVRMNANYLEKVLRAHVLIALSPKHTQRVAHDLSRIAQVRTLHTASGAYDMIAVVEAETAGELDGLLDQIGMLPGIERTVSSILLATKFRR